MTKTNQTSSAIGHGEELAPLTFSELQGKRAAAVVFSHYPSDPRPRRAAEALVQAGMEVEVICLKQDEKEPAREVFNGVKITRVPLKRKRGGKLGYAWQYGAFLLASFFILSWRTLTRRYNLVHVHNMPDVLVFSALLPKLRGAKVILDLHDPMPELMMTIFGLAPQSFGVRLLEWFEKWSIGFADVVLVVNEACRRLFSERSCSIEKIGVIMNSPDEMIFAPQGEGKADGSKPIGAHPFVIMYHGSLVERHGLDLAVTALDALRRTARQAELRIYGQRTPFLEGVLASVKGTELESSVSYFGPKGLEGIVKAIRSCDVGIIPNRKSIFTQINTPTRIFEYLSQGKPVIAPRVPGIEDYFGPEDLVFFELGSAADLAAKLEHVFRNYDQVLKTVRAGQAVYIDHKWSNERGRFLEVAGNLLRVEGNQPVATAGAERAIVQA